MYDNLIIFQKVLYADTRIKARRCGLRWP